MGLRALLPIRREEPASASGIAPASRARIPWRWCAPWLALALAIFEFPAQPEVGLDPSWRMVLGHALAQRWQFGRDVVFTYGPLGALLGNTYAGEGLVLLLAGQAAFALGLAGLVVHRARQSRGWPRAAFLAFWPLVAVGARNALHLLAMLLIGLVLAHRRPRAPRLRELVGLAALAVLAAEKFTHLLLAAVIVAALGARAALRTRRAGAALAPIAGFAAVWLGVWSLAGQELASLLPYLRNSLEVTRGYVDGMGLEAPPELLRDAAAVWALLGLWLIDEARRRKLRAEGILDGALLGAFAFALWKNGFVRADGHTGTFFVGVLGAAVIAPLFHPRAARDSRLRAPILASIAVACLIGIDHTWPESVRGLVGTLEARLWNNAERFALGRGLADDYAARLEGRRRDAALPRVRAAVGSATLDVFGHEQAVALLNDLHYHPRPVFQGYSAYTPELARLNQRFYASADAPEFVLFKSQSIDGRLPAFDDSLALRELLRGYRRVLSEGGFALLRRTPSAAPAPRVVQREVQTIDLGAPIDLCALPSGPTWVEISAPLSPLGALRALLLRPPIVQLDLVLRGGRSQSFRLPLDAAATGFLVNPLLAAGAPHSHLARSSPAGRVERLRVRVRPEDRAYFAGEASVAVEPEGPVAAPDPARVAAEVDPRSPGAFRVFRSLPAEYRAHATVAAGTIAREPVAVVHAPSVVSLVARPGSRLVRGALGFVPEAWSGEGRSDGANFRVVWWHAGHREVLLERFLDPRRVPAHRGLVAFAVPFDGRDGGAIDLEIDPGPRGDNAFDWTAWTRAEIR